MPGGVDTCHESHQVEDGMVGAPWVSMSHRLQQ